MLRCCVRRTKPSRRASLTMPRHSGATSACTTPCGARAVRTGQPLRRTGSSGSRGPRALCFAVWACAEPDHQPAAARMAARVASRWTRPWRRSGTRWLPSAYTFQTLTKTRSRSPSWCHAVRTRAKRSHSRLRSGVEWRPRSCGARSHGWLGAAGVGPGTTTPRSASRKRLPKRWSGST